VPEQVKMKKTSTVRHISLLASDTPMVQCRRTEKGVCSRQDTRNSLNGTGSSGNQTLTDAHTEILRHTAHTVTLQKPTKNHAKVVETTRSSQVNVQESTLGMCSDRWSSCGSVGRVVRMSVRIIRS
jgi:hypothetical protein